jgi:hypothetical protein
MGGKVASVAKTTSPGKTASVRSAAAVDKDAHIRSLGGKVMPRGKLSDQATGRLTKVPGISSKKTRSIIKRDWHGRFAE